MSIRNRIYNYIGKVLLIFLGAACTIWAFVDMFEISVSMPFILMFIFLVDCIFMLITYLKHKNIVMLGISILMTVFIIIWHKILEFGLLGVLNRIIEVYNEYFPDQPVNKYIIQYYKVSFFNTPKQLNTLFICVVLSVYVFVLTFATYYKVFPSLHIILSMAFIIVGMLLGVMPSTACVSLLIFYYLSCVAFGKNKNIYLGRMGGLAVAVAVITGIVLLAVNPKKYDGEKKYDNYNKLVDKVSYITSIDKITNRLEYLFTDKKVSAGGINGGKLGQVDKIKYSGDKVLKIYMDRDSNNVYLKGFVGNWYNGSNWKSMAVNDMVKYEEYRLNSYTGCEKIISNSFDYVCDNCDIGSLKNMSVTCLDKTGNYVFYPYCSDISIPWSAYDMNQIMPDSFSVYRLDMNIWEYNYCSLKTDNILDLFVDNDVYAYNDSEFFCGMSTDVPDNIRELFDKLLGDGIEKQDYTSLSDADYIRECIQYIRTYLSKNTSYTLNPGRLKQGEDYVEEFLVKKKKGYCTAYASAATLMFRYYGIPARYVEGYVITEKDQSKGNKTEESDKVLFDLDDSAAHAWTEIYVSGVGFIPIEVTTGYYSEQDMPDDTHSVKKDNYEESSEIPESESYSETYTSEENKNIKTTDDSGRIVTDKKKDKANDKRMYIILGIIAVSGCIILSVIMVMANTDKRKKRLLNYETEDMRKNIKVLEIYFKRCMDKQKIKYSKDRASEEIASDINAAINRMKELNNQDISKGKGDKNIEIPDTSDTQEVLFIIQKQKYSDENTKFTFEEYKKVRQYVENLKNSLQYFKNRL